MELTPVFSTPDLLPVDGQDEGYEVVRQNLQNIEDELEAELDQYKKDLK